MVDRTIVCVLVLATTWLTVREAKGELLAADSFLVGDRDSPTSVRYKPGFLQGQRPRVSPGFTSGNRWSGSVNTHLLTEPMTLRADTVGYPSRGARVWWDPDGRNRVQFLQRELDKPVQGSELFAAVIIHPGWDFPTFADEFGVVAVGFTSRIRTGDLTSDAKQVLGVMVGFAGDPATKEVDLVLRTQSPGEAATIHTIAHDIPDGPQLVAWKITTNVQGPLDEVQFWVDPWSLLSEEKATDTASLTGTIQVDCVHDLRDLTRMSFVSVAWDRKMFFDEPRLATQIADLAEYPRKSSSGWLISYAATLLLISRVVYVFSRTERIGLSVGRGVSARPGPKTPG